MTGRPYDVNIPIRNICHMEMTIFLLDYNFSCLILFLDLHFGEILSKKKIGLLFFIFFIKKSPIIFILFYEIFNFLVNSLKSIIKSKWNNYFPLDSILSRRVWKYSSSIAQEEGQVKAQENTWNTTTSPYIRPHGGILISRFCLIMPSVSPIMVTRLFSSLYCVRKIELLFWL